jgi:uncharacterized protein (DUF2235 family)
MEEAYSFISAHYQDGDRIFLYGFSRGAYTVRALAAVIRHLGLLEHRNENLYYYMEQIFARRVPNRENPRKKSPDFELYAKFRNNFARTVNIHFVGAFDTVNSVGWVHNPLVLPSTSKNPIVQHVRHAVAIDERRKNFRESLFVKATKDQDVKEVWFAGAHADVGGGYEEAHSGLSKIALEWMLDESELLGLVVKRSRKERVLGRNNPDYCAPSETASLHNQLDSLGWKLVQLAPRRALTKVLVDGKEEYKLAWDWGVRARPRPIEPTARVHESVQLRMACDSSYSPPNIGPMTPDRIEPWPGRPPAPPAPAS